MGPNSCQLTAVYIDVILHLGYQKGTSNLEWVPTSKSLWQFSTMIGKGHFKSEKWTFLPKKECWTSTGQSPTPHSGAIIKCIRVGHKQDFLIIECSTNFVNKLWIPLISFSQICLLNAKTFNNNHNRCFLSMSTHLRNRIDISEGKAIDKLQLYFWYWVYFILCNKIMNNCFYVNFLFKVLTVRFWY